MKWAIAVIVAMIISALIIFGICAMGSVMSAKAAIWAKSDSLLTASQRALISFSQLVSRFTFFVFPVCLTVSLLIAAKFKKAG